MQRVHSIDYLRGFLALSVMIYHYISWSVGVPDSSTVLGRLGIYAVSTFYIISGISLYLVYTGTSWSTSNTVRFAIKRVCRIAPLYWVATIATIAFFILKPGPFLPNWLKYFSNLTLTFGFFSPSSYVPSGGWSIGNEMVFYAIFPILTLMASRTWSLIIGLLAFTGVYLHFAFNILTPEHSLAEQWRLYINPFNQAFLFFIGIIIGFASKNHPAKGGALPYLALVSSLFAFALWPANGNQINIVTGYNRLAFTAICATACWSILNAKIAYTGIATKILKYFGDISYSIYLLHGAIHLYTIAYIYPLVCTQPSPEAKLYSLLFISTPVTLTTSYLVYRYIEQPFIRFGKNLTNTMAESPPEPQDVFPPPYKG